MGLQNIVVRIIVLFYEEITCVDEDIEERPVSIVVTSLWGMDSRQPFFCVGEGSSIITTSSRSPQKVGECTSSMGPDTLVIRPKTTIRILTLIQYNPGRYKDAQ